MNESIVATIRQIAERAYAILGSGHSETDYRNAIQVMLRLKRIDHEGQKRVETHHQDDRDLTYPDLLVRCDTQSLLVEVKAKSGEVGKLEQQELRDCLKILHLSSGLVVNFQKPSRTGKPTCGLQFKVVDIE